MKINIDRLISNKKYCEEVFKLFIKKKVIRENKLKFFGKHINKALSNLEFANFLLEEHKNSIKEKLPNKMTKQTHSKTPLSCDIFLYITQTYNVDCTIQKNPKNKPMSQ